MDESKLENIDDIDLERVVVDRLYRRRVIAFLNGVEGAQADSGRRESTDQSPSS